ncbi:MAG: tRNA (adenosine(37)-N6)-threonylcarbamoyltransferase complex transferase subunit TsaD [Candidatus Glassbacteria bacterium]
MITIGIETSCDETSVAVLEGTANIRSLIVLSQDEHLKFGGVVPEIASRAHVRTITSVFEEALRRADVGIGDIDVLGVTCGPGLVGSLLVGISFARGLSMAHRVPLVGVNHLEAHLFSALLADPEVQPPFLGLIVSGGHSMLIHCRELGTYEVLGRTRDDAVGEAFDKVAKLLGLPYPGGPSIEKEADGGRPDFVKFPRPMLKAVGDEVYDFSYSGLKTAVVNFVKARGERFVTEHRRDICRSFEEAAIEVLVEKGRIALEERSVSTFLLVGGVACNRLLRQRMGEMVREGGAKLTVPQPVLCTDNGAMVARTALFRYEMSGASDEELNAVANAPLPGSMG